MLHAPEFPNDLRWFNLPAQAGSKPLSLKDLRGKAVLLDFWTYSCVNCIRTLPHLRAWQEKYAAAGLVVIGVHTPEFEFEKDVSNVGRALKQFDIKYPVVMDSDYQIWSLYANEAWPRKILIDKDGKAAYDHAGEGNYKETEEAIQKALLEINPKLKLLAVSAEEGSGGVCLPTTPETYLGTMRGRPGKLWRAVGEWKTHQEFIEHERTTEQFEDYLTLQFEGAEVNLVMSSTSERPAKVRVEMDGKLVRELEVKEPKMYNLLAGHKKGKGELRIFTKDQGFRAYAFTFGGYCD